MKLPAIYEQPIDGLENFEMNGDDLAVTADCFRKIEEKEVAAATHANERCSRHQCQIITEKGNEMSTTNSSKTGSVNHPSWAIPSRMRVFGPDVMHQGATYRLERGNDNGDEYGLIATLTQLEEIGQGFTTDPYVSLGIVSEPFGETLLNLDISELETITDWLCGLVEKVHHLKPQP